MPEISTVTVTGSTAIVQGVEFRFPPETGFVVLSPSTNVDDPARAIATVSQWTDDRIAVSSFVGGPYWFVVDADGFASPPYRVPIPQTDIYRWKVTRAGYGDLRFKTDSLIEDALPSRD